MKKNKISLSEHFTYPKLLRFVWPCVAMMLTTSLYSIVDGYFISNFVGKTCFAAVNLTWPFLVLMEGIGFMIGTGGSALISFTLGQGDEKRANEIFSMLVKWLAIIGAIVSAIAFVFMPQIAKLLGAEGELLAPCILYGRILLVGNPFFLIQAANQSFLTAAERPRMSFLIAVFAGVANMGLDFLLVYVFPFGLWGAALATVFSQVVGALVPTIYFLRPKNNSRLRLVRSKFNGRDFGKVCLNGSSEMMTTLASSVVGFLFNFQLLKLAGENGVAAYGAIMYVGYLFAAIFFGYAVGVTPLVGYHYGAENRRELRNLLKKSTILMLVTGIIMFALGESLAGVVAKIYVGYDETLTQMTVHGMRLYAFMLIIMGLNVFASSFFTGLNNGLVSAAISFLRSLVFEVIAILLLPRFWGINGVWCAPLFAEGLTLIVSFTLLWWNRKRYGYWG